MLNIIERRITLQLLVFYCLFVLPLLLGGMELYFFQRDSLQQNAQQADVNLAHVIALDIAANAQHMPQDAFTPHLIAIRQLLASGGDVQLWLVESSGMPLASTATLPPRTSLIAVVPELKGALAGKSGSLFAHAENRDWLYSFAPVSGLPCTAGSSRRCRSWRMP